MADDFQYDVFLSHSSEDKVVVREVAERLRDDGLRVWFDEWKIQPGDSIPGKIEEGLEHSRVLVLCMSAHAFGSDWAQLESQTFRFRDPLNKERRFIPLRLDEAPVRGSLAQFLYIDWLTEDREAAYAKLRHACYQPVKPGASKPEVWHQPSPIESIELEYPSPALIQAYAFGPDGRQALTGEDDGTVRMWDLASGRCVRVLEGHSKRKAGSSGVSHVKFGAQESQALSGSYDCTLRVWDLTARRCLRVLEGHSEPVVRVAWNTDRGQAFSTSIDQTSRLWDIDTGRCVRIFTGHEAEVYGLGWNVEEGLVLTGSKDRTMRLWAVDTGKCLRVFKGHTEAVTGVAWSQDSSLALSGSWDTTLRLWETKTGRCLRVLEGHTDKVIGVVWGASAHHALSWALDKTIRVWNVVTGRCLGVLKGHDRDVEGVAWDADGRRIFSGDDGGRICVWDLSDVFNERELTEVEASFLPTLSDQVQYTNAKVLVVGESGAGKTGLSKRLAFDAWEPTDSTVGAWATQWKLPVASDDDVEREIWLWDFGGQADQRLIHQLYMDETALAVLVFDGQKDDLFETLGQWDHDLTRASGREFAKLLVAGRVDTGGLRCSPGQIAAFAKERGYPGLLETSAKTGTGCEELKQAILDGIRWEEIPWQTSPRVFKRLKEEILRLKDEGRVLMRFNELRDSLQLRMAGDGNGKVERFVDEELKAVIGLLAGPGAVWELKFGSWVLLQPEMINAYAQAVIQTLREDRFELGCISEERVLSGDLKYQSSAPRLPEEEERIILLAMHQLLVERAFCLREHTETGTLLVFPSYYRRERKELTGHPAVQVSYRFHGLLDKIYAPLVVRLHHAQTFENDELWRYSADFKTLTGKQLGVKLTRLGEGAGELAAYFDPEIPIEEKILFSKYIHEHVMRNGQEVVRLRHYVCSHCGTEAGNRDVAMNRLNAWLDGDHGGDVPTMICVDCEKRFPLWDEMEHHFASPEAQQRVRELQERSELILDNESKERVLVGDVISTVALAGQISREFAVSDHGIDMEIEFKNDGGEATGQKLYLQLKSGDSYLRERKRDGSAVFRIAKERHADYWRKQTFPVLLVIRTADGEVRWMEIREYLRRESEDGKKAVKQIVFEGERFDVMSVRAWRERVLGATVH